MRTKKNPFDELKESTKIMNQKLAEYKKQRENSEKKSNQDIAIWRQTIQQKLTQKIAFTEDVVVKNNYNYSIDKSSTSSSDPTDNVFDTNDKINHDDPDDKSNKIQNKLDILDDDFDYIKVNSKKQYQKFDLESLIGFRKSRLDITNIELDVKSPETTSPPTHNSVKTPDSLITHEAPDTSDTPNTPNTPNTSETHERETIISDDLQQEIKETRDAINSVIKKSTNANITDTQTKHLNKDILIIDKKMDKINDNVQKLFQELSGLKTLLQNNHQQQSFQLQSLSDKATTNAPASTALTVTEETKQELTPEEKRAAKREADKKDLASHVSMADRLNDMRKREFANKKDLKQNRQKKIEEQKQYALQNLPQHVKNFVSGAQQALETLRSA
jgi:hypothetical protein